MNVNDTLHGFVVREVRTLPEIRATMVRMEYARNGADLIWLDRADENKTFAITFKTIPEDDTGVFHILEHSVLNGSKKYPVREPFVELLKSSLQTFLNAFTFPDKTMYPVCSRNDQDFLNLMDVYLDAVLHPLSMEDPHAFLQEGWHYELDTPDGDLRLNGVVFNEMKGAYSDPDTVLQGELNRLLFPDNCYRCESGGHPEHIPALTYDQYRASHARFYHPSNSRIFLDGAMDLDAVLGRLDEYLRDFDRLDIDSAIPMQQPVAPQEQTVHYAVGMDEDLHGKAILGAGWVYGRFDELDKLTGCSALTELLCGSNEAPLTKALLDAGLCEDVAFQQMDGIQQLYAVLAIHNADETRLDEVWQTVDAVLQQSANGLDHRRLSSILSRMEYQAREKDFGGMPRGLVYGLTAMDTWLYDGDPAQKLCSDSLYQALQKKIEEGWFENLLREIFLDNPHRAKIRLLPSVTLAAEAAEREAGRLEILRERMTPEQLSAVAEQFRSLRIRQNTPDTQEQLDALPVLSLQDIPETVAASPGSRSLLDGVTLLHQPLDTDGIIHLNLYFSQADLPQDAVSPLGFFTSLPGDMATEHYSPLELHSEIDAHLGRFQLAAGVTGTAGQTEQAIVRLTLSVSLLESRKEQALQLIDEIVNRSVYTNREQILNLLRQNRFLTEQTIQQSGSRYAVLRVNAAASAQGALQEQLHGISALRWMQNTEATFDASWPALCETFTSWGKTLFSRQRLTIGYTGNLDENWLRQLLAIFPDAPTGAPVTYQKAGTSSEGFAIPAQIGYAAKSANLNNVGAVYSGVSRVAAQLLTYDYLWNAVRVQGGAYGVGLNIRADGQVSASSYRDPSPAASLGVFDRCGKALRAFCKSTQPLEKYIISTLAVIDPLLSPRMQGIVTESYWFTGRPADALQKVYTEILHTTKDDLYRFADTLDAIMAASGSCIVGGNALLGSMEHIEAI